MNAFWQYFWPLFAVGLVAGAIPASIAFRRRRRSLFLIGFAIALAWAVTWNWPLGAADRLASSVERDARAALVDWEMPQVQARLQRDPLTRQLVLSGPADDFQRAELVRILGAVPGVSDATWSADTRALPIVAEAAMTSVLGFLLGLLLAYVIELRRRYNAQWRW